MAKVQSTTVVRKPKRTTMADVAAEVGCSPALVSSVINRATTSANASEALAHKIREAAVRLGYRADFASQSLARRSTRTIGIYVPPVLGAHIGYAYESAILHGVVCACQEQGFDVLAINLGGGGTPDSCFHKFTERRIDGVVLVHVPHNADWVAPLMRHHLHAVSVNYHGSVRALSRLNFDDRAATAMAVDHLVKLGHRRIAYIGLFMPNPGPEARLRRKGFDEAMKAHGLSVPDSWIVDSTNPRLADSLASMDFNSSAESSINHLLRQPGPRPTALVCYDDLIAIMVLRCLRNYGIRVPADISLTGIDDMDLASFVDPPLTTIRQPLIDMGTQAAQLLLEAVTNPAQIAVRQVPELVAPSLVVRASSATPAANCP